MTLLLSAKATAHFIVYVKQLLWLCDCDHIADVDECLLDLATCHLNATCINTNGGFLCICNDGFAGDGSDCTGYNYNNSECIKTHCDDLMVNVLMWQMLMNVFWILTLAT